ncbi:ABC transporter ATP-binding protein [Paenibacillus macerans]|uniref:ABC transporter ATP-binding protein n=1 Tax=Paenibacillus sp. FSL R5-0527 TaxID=2975321 RepID=UPI00097AD3F9|nr:sodium ABC transporter ATP-binding protein [Paenibacillus macerans]GJM73301.1 ABC transporter ATP-binding protein [Paenibacillus macerans]
MNNILEVSGLCKSYRDFSLENVSFSLPEGCITGFIGINGAGKTTTIKTILGLVQRRSGTVKVFGKELDKHERELKNRIGVVLDGGSFYDDLTMAEMKSVIAPAYSKWNDKTFKEYMESFSLNSRQKIATLSKGMRMKYALALALSHEAELLIMDEPTSGLDPLIRSQLLAIIKDYMKQEGKGVFFSTHITSDLDKVADMLILIDQGKIIFEQEKDTLLEGHHVVKGDINALNSKNRSLFLNLQATNYSFTGITKHLPDVQQMMSDIVIERPTIENIMLAYIERGLKG